MTITTVTSRELNRDVGRARKAAKSGPAFHRFGNRVRYRRSELDAWAARRRATTTAEADRTAAPGKTPAVRAPRSVRPACGPDTPFARSAGTALEGSCGRTRDRWRSALPGSGMWYLRTRDGGLSSMHDLVPRNEAGGHRVVFFNPASNTRRASALRLVNPGPEPAEVVIEGTDGDGASPGTAVSLSVPARGARRVTAQALESADGRGEASRDLAGALGDGAGKWRLVVRSDEALQVMSLLSTSTGHLSNLSTAPGAAVRGNGCEPGWTGMSCPSFWSARCRSIPRWP